MKPGGSVSKVAPKHLCNQPFNCTTSATLLSTLSSSKLRDTVVLLPLNYAYNLWKGQLPFMVGTNSAVQKLPVLHGCALHTCADICATHTTKITRTPHGNHAQTEGQAAAAKGRRRSWWLELRSGSERSTPGPCWCSSNWGIFTVQYHPGKPWKPNLGCGWGQHPENEPGIPSSSPEIQDSNSGVHYLSDCESQR